MSSARPNGVPGWSTGRLRFSSTKVTPASSPRSAMRSRVSRALSHIAPVTTSQRLDRQALAVETGAVKVQPRDAELLRDRDRLARGAQQLVRAVVVGERAGDVAGHRREGGAGRGERLDVVLGPVPDLDLEAEVMQALHPVEDRQAAEEHLRAGGEGEGNVLRRARRWSLSLRCGGVPVSQRGPGRATTPGTNISIQNV